MTEFSLNDSSLIWAQEYGVTVLSNNTNATTVTFSTTLGSGASLAIRVIHNPQPVVLAFEPLNFNYFLPANSLKVSVEMEVSTNIREPACTLVSTCLPP